MVVGGGARILGRLLLGLALAYALGVPGVSAATGCSVEVSPRAGAAGTVFVFSGAGFEPTRLVLLKDGEPAGSHELDAGDQGEPWQVTVRSRPGDEGEWSAELSSDECTATAEFRVTLANTDAADTVAAAAQPGRGVPLVALLALATLALCGGLTLGRRLRLASVDNRGL